MGRQRCSSLWQTLHFHPVAYDNCKFENVSRFKSVTNSGGSRCKSRRGSKHLVYDWGKLKANLAMGVSSGDTVLNQSRLRANGPRPASRKVPMLDVNGRFGNGCSDTVLHDKSKMSRRRLRQRERSENYRHND